MPLDVFGAARRGSSILSLTLLVVGATACTDEAPSPTPGGRAGSAGASNGGGGGAGMPSMAGAAGSILPMAGSAGAGGVDSSIGGGGASGAAGLSGSGGSAGAGGSGGASPAVRSAGCGMQAAQPLASWSERPQLDVEGDDRQWWVWLPSGYDPMRAYPVIFTLHGCGGPGNFIPIQEETGGDAIVVRGTGAANGCWTYGLEGDDVKFFDAMLAALEAQYCMDTSRVFSIGYSSGGWMTNTLECSRGDKLRATGTLSGGRAHNGQNCKGKFARATVHDVEDGTNPFDDWEEENGVKHDGQGAAEELARVLAQNHCMADVPPVPEGPTPCARYQGCDPGYPVVACMTEGEGHDRQDDLAIEAFWKLFSSL